MGEAGGDDALLACVVTGLPFTVASEEVEGSPVGRDVLVRTSDMDVGMGNATSTVTSLSDLLKKVADADLLAEIARSSDTISTFSLRTKMSPPWWKLGGGIVGEQERTREEGERGKGLRRERDVRRKLITHLLPAFAARRRYWLSR